MFEPTEHAVDEAVQQSMQMFERSRIGEIAPVEPQRPRRLVLALDGSDQDPLGIAIARALRQRWDVGLFVLDAREQPVDDGLATDVARTHAAEVVPRQTGESFQQILSGMRAVQGEMLIVPCPFGRSMDNVGPDSTGTVIDVLLARSPCPLLVIRKPYELNEEPFQRLSLIVSDDHEAVWSAARWSLGALVPRGELDLVLVLEASILDHVQHLVAVLEPDIDVTAEQLLEAMQRTHVRLHRALQKAAHQLRLQYSLRLRREALDSLQELTSGTERLMALALARSDPAAEGQVRDRIRRSHHCVLVVPVDQADASDARV